MMLKILAWRNYISLEVVLADAKNKLIVFAFIRKMLSLMNKQENVLENY